MLAYVSALFSADLYSLGTLVELDCADEEDDWGVLDELATLDSLDDEDSSELDEISWDELGNNVNTLEWFLDSPARGRSYPESLIKKNKRGPGNHRPDLVCFL